jgi:phosphatidylglycerol:prolipoprotein diacylglycerol transferase
LQFPEFDPIAIHFTPTYGIRWYALAYITGLVAGWRYMRWMAAKAKARISATQIDDFLVWATVGVVLGGRLGYILFYKPSYYFANPLEMVQLWNGGMSFHGAAVGVIAAIVLFCRTQKIEILVLGDLVCCAQPIGQFFGRVANFINGELWGREADPSVPWAMVFPHDPDQLLRHPSQLYEAGLEGLALFVILHLLWRQEAIRNRPGFLAGAYLIGYGVARIISEFFRQPDDFMGFLWAGATMGQLLSIPLLIVGSLFILRAKKKAA